MKRSVLLLAVFIMSLMLLAFTPYAQAQGDITQFGSNVVVPEGEVQEGNVTVFGGNVVIEGDVEGNVSVFGGNLRINGRVGENVTHFGGNTALGHQTVIEGNFAHFGGRVTKAPEARIEGTETAGFRGFNPFASLLFGLLSLIGTLVLAAVVVALLPTQTTVLADTIERQPLNCAGVGFLSTILIPVIFIALALLIIVGWILIPFVALAIPLVYFYGYVGAARWLGMRIIRATHFVSDSPIAQVLTGVLILGLIALIPILGGLIVFIAAIIGLGAVILSKFGTGRPWFGGRATTQVPPSEAERKGAA